jgi:hypothetical protein
MKKLPPLARNDRGAYDCARFRASGCKTYATKKVVAQTLQTAETQ